MALTIKKLVPPQVESNLQRYEIVYPKTVKDINDVDVTIVDRKETVTKEYLEQQKQSYLDHIAEIDDKLAQINQL